VRVALLNQYYAPDEAATAQLLSDLGQGLAAAGHEVSAVCCRRSYADPSVRYLAREEVGGVAVRRTWATGFGRGSKAGRLADYLTFLGGAAWRMLRQPRPDVVISLSTPPLVAALGLMLARLRRARSVYWVMDVYPDLAFELGVLRPGSLAGRFFSRVSNFALGGSQVIVALGECMAERLRAKGLASVDAVHNWADGDAIRPRSLEGHALRERWGWDERFIVLYSGNMGLAHEFDTTLDAAEILRDHPRVRFAFVGDGPRRNEVEAEARRRGLTNVEFRDGLLEEMPVEDGWADVVISNGVINLCADKERVFSEIRRILRPGGHLQFADIANGKPVPPSAVANVDLWTA